MSIAIFPGSFDPITNGHLNIALKASKIFDQVYVLVMTNTHKNYFFSETERLALTIDAFKDYPNIKVLKRSAELTVEVAKELKANAIIRGVRNTNDFLYEQQIAEINRQLMPDIQTVLLFTNPEDSFVASSMIKEIASFNGNVTQFLPKKAALALKEKMQYNANKN